MSNNRKENYSINMEHSDKILEILAEKNIAAVEIAKATGISESLFSTWKSKPSSNIKSDNLLKIAEYLDVSIDYILGRTHNPEINHERLSHGENVG